MTSLTAFFAPARLSLYQFRAHWQVAATTALSFCVVSVILLSVLTAGQSMAALWASHGAPQVAVVMSEGAFSEMDSSISVESIERVSQVPGLAGSSQESIVPVFLGVWDFRGGTHPDLKLAARGFFEIPRDGLMSELTLLSGKYWSPGQRQVVVGRALADSLGLAAGNVIRIGKGDFTAVGVFESNASVFESEVWGDAGLISNALGRPPINVARITLNSVSAFDAFQKYLSTAPGLSLSAVRESEMFDQKGRLFKQLVLAPGLTFAAIMALCSTFSALNTMNSVVEARRRDLVTLRALGFGRLSLSCALLSESLFVSAVGSGVGILFVAVTLPRLSFMTGTGYTSVSMRLGVTPSIALLTLFVCMGFGALGGLIPAIVGSRQRIGKALREV